MFWGLGEKFGSCLNLFWGLGKFDTFGALFGFGGRRASLGLDCGVPKARLCDTIVAARFVTQRVLKHRQQRRPAGKGWN